MARLAGRGTRPRSTAKDRRRRLSCLARNGRRSRGRQSPAKLRAGTASVGSKPEEDADRVGPAGERGLKPVHLGPSPRPGRCGRRHPLLKRALWTFLSVEVEPGGDRKQVAFRIAATCGAGSTRPGSAHRARATTTCRPGSRTEGAAPDFPGSTRPRAASIRSGANPPARPSRSARTPDRHESARRHAAGVSLGRFGRMQEIGGAAPAAPPFPIRRRPVPRRCSRPPRHRPTR